MPSEPHLEILPYAPSEPHGEEEGFFRKGKWPQNECRLALKRQTASFSPSSNFFQSSTAISPSPWGSLGIHGHTRKSTIHYTSFSLIVNGLIVFKCPLPKYAQLPFSILNFEHTQNKGKTLLSNNMFYCKILDIIYFYNIGNKSKHKKTPSNKTNKIIFFKIFSLLSNW